MINDKEVERTMALVNFYAEATEDLVSRIDTTPGNKLIMLTNMIHILETAKGKYK